MDELIRKGKLRTLLISLAIIFVSLHTIYFYHSVRPEIEITKLIQQGIRFILTVVLLILIYKGKKWATIISIFLFSIAAVTALIAVFSLNDLFVNRIPLFVMIIVYAIAVYHFGISKSFNAFFNAQRVRRHLLTDKE